MDKGFIHVLEAILVSLILIISVPFLLNSGPHQVGWENAKLKYIGEDLLASMDRTGFDSNGESDLQDIMEKNVNDIDDDISSFTGGRRTGFNVRSVGAVKNEIRIGCSCTDVERSDLERRLGVVRVNERYVTFRVFPFRYDLLAQSDFDVIFIDGDSQLRDFEDFYEVPANERAIRDHLSRGNGIVEFVDLDGTELGDAVQSEVFGIQPGGGIMNSDGDFVNKNDPLTINYYIAKYFPATGMALNFTDGPEQPLKIRGTPPPPPAIQRNVRFNELSPEIDIDLNLDGTYGPGETDFVVGSRFSVSAAGVIQEYEVDDIDMIRLLVQFNMANGTEYLFHDFSSSPVRPAGSSKAVVIGDSPAANALIVNATGPGKTAWVSRSDSDDVEGLLRSAVMWAAGENWDNVVRTVSSTQSSVSYAVSQGEEFYEPYVVESTLWNIF